MKFKEILMTVNLQGQIVKFAKSDRTKLSYAFTKKNVKNLNELQKKHYNDVLEDKKLDLAIVGPNKEVLYDERGAFKHTKESIKELKQLEESLMDTEIEDFTVYTVKFSDLSEEELKAFWQDGNFADNVDTEMHTALSRFITELPEFKEYTEYAETI